MGLNSVNPSDTFFALTDDEIKKCREMAFSAKPYREDDEHYQYFDWPGAEDREKATSAMRLLKAAGLWNAEDEKKAFG